MGPFKFSISKVAQFVSLEDISQVKCDILAQGVSFDPDQHDVFLFFVIPEFIQSKKGSKRTRRKRSYSKVDRIFIKVKLPTSDIKLLGMYPTSRTDTNTYEVDNIPYIPIVGKLKAHGRVKDAIKRGKHLIVANRNDEIAQWVFLKPYIEQRTDFGMKVLCLVPKDLDDEYRFLRCNASAQDKGREIEGAYRRKILFPSS